MTHLSLLEKPGQSSVREQRRVVAETVNGEILSDEELTIEADSVTY